MSLVNKNSGVVSWVSPDRTTIKIRMPRGGSVKAQNSGFEVGDVVAFTLNPMGNRVVQVMHKFVADIMVEIGRNPLLQSALQEEEVSDGHNPEIYGIEDDRPDSRPSSEECPDLYGAEHREDAADWADQPFNPLGQYFAPWIEG